jgi:hypothetical protein
MLSIGNELIFVKLFLDHVKGFPIFFDQELGAIFFTLVKLVIAVFNLLSDWCQLFGQLMVLNKIMGFTGSHELFMLFLSISLGVFLEHLIARLLIKH